MGQNKRQGDKMPKVVIEFNLPEENEEFQLHIKGKTYWAVIHKLMQDYRQDLKYANLSEDERKTIERNRSFLFELLEEEGVISDFV